MNNTQEKTQPDSKDPPEVGINPLEVGRLTCTTVPLDAIVLLKEKEVDEYTCGRHENNKIVIDFSKRISKYHFVIIRVSTPIILQKL